MCDFTKDIHNVDFDHILNELPTTDDDDDDDVMLNKIFSNLLKFCSTRKISSPNRLTL